MYLQLSTLQTLLLLLLPPAIVNAGIAPMMSKPRYSPLIIRTQTELNALCKTRCNTTMCYLEDEIDCRRFIVCFKGPRQQYTATLKRCAFGTYWDGSFACDLPQNVQCGLDYCSGNEGSNYPHVGNCKTFWRCAGPGKSPVPRCCTNGTYFDPTVNNCVTDINDSCLESCPITEEPCKKGLPAEDYSDGNCKTFWNCTDDVSHAVCCPDGQGFNPVTDECEVMASCNDLCPDKYKPTCILKPGSTPDTFLLGGVIQRCSPGTKFDLRSCACGIHVKTQEDSACQLEFNTRFDFGGLRRNGTQRARVVQKHDSVRGPDYEGIPSHRFGTMANTEFSVQYFQQVFPNLYVNMIYQPDDAATGEPMLMLSNCMNVDLGAPSLHLILQDGQIHLLIVTNNLVNDTANPGQMTYHSALTSVPFTPGEWNRYSVIYNGQNVYVLNEVLGNTQTLPSTATKPLQGAISVAAEGLDIGRCTVGPSQGIRGYRGSLAQLQFTKCLRQEWINSYNTVAQKINQAADPSPLGPSPA